MSNTEFRQTVGSAGIIGIAALLGSVIGFVLQLLVAYYFGAGNETDAFFMAQSTSEMLGKLLMGGSITAVFIPLFVERLTTGRTQEAWNLGCNIINIMVGVYLLFIAILWFFADQFVGFIAPGFIGETHTLTVSLLRVLLPSFLFLFLVEFATSMLHSFKKFALPASLRLVAPTISIISILLFVHPLRIYALAIGVVLGSIVQLIILVFGLTNIGMRYRFFMKPSDPAIRSLLHLVYPFIFSILATQGAGIVYRVLVSGLTEGSLSALKFAEKITQLLTIVCLNSITLVIYPLLSEKATKKDFQGIQTTIGSAMRLIFFITLPLIISIAILREPIVSFVFERGLFSASDTEATSTALLYLVLGLTTTGISSVLGHAVLAIQKTKAAVAITIASQIVAMALFYLLVPLMGMAGLALASSLVPLSSALLYFLYLQKHVASLKNIFVHRTYPKTVALTLIACSLVWFVMQITSLFPIALIAGAAFYLIAAYLWHVEEMQGLTDIVYAKLKRRAIV